MPRHRWWPAELAGEVFRGSDAVAEGMLTPGQLQGNQWRRLLRDVYADARLPVDHRVMIEAAALVVPSGAVFCRRSAAVLHGVALARERDPVELTLPAEHQFARYGGLAVHREMLDAGQVVRAGSHPATDPHRSAADLARQPSLVRAVAALDAMLHAGVTDEAAVAAVIDRAGVGRRAPRYTSTARRALQLCDRHSESPLESEARVRLVLAGLPVPAVQYEIWRLGALVARVDLAYPERLLAIELDGAWHADDLQLRKDRRRLNELTAAGWTVLHFTAADLSRRAEYVVAQVRERLRRVG